MKKLIVSFIVFVLAMSLVTSVGFAFTTLKVGSKGDNVKKVQTVLKNHNYNVKVDGSYGSKTAYYVKLYQKMHHLSADGRVGEKTWNYMMDDFDLHKQQVRKVKTELPLKKSDKINEDVKFVQQILKAHRYPVSVDGKFGSKTEKYVKHYQKAHYLSVDGKVGWETWESMSAGYKILPYVWKKATLTYTPKRFPISAEAGSSADIKFIKQALEQKDPEQDLVLHTVDGEGKSVYTGQYDQATADAVVAFQTANGLDADGIVQREEWAKLVWVDADNNNIDDNIDLLAKIISMESGGANEYERIAIASVVIDHANDAYNGNIYKELHDTDRYDPCDNWSRFIGWKPGSQCYDSAKKAYYDNINSLNGKKAYYFHVKSIIPPPSNWRFRNCELLGLVDKHVFWGP